MTTKKHREPLETLPVGAEALTELRSRSRRSDPPPAGDEEEGREQMPTLPFDLRDAPVSEGKTREPQATIPFQLVRTSSRPPPPHPGMPASGKPIRWAVWLVVLVLVAAAIVALLALGVVELPAGTKR